MSKASQPIEALNEACKKLKDIEKGDINTLAATLWEMSVSYFRTVRRQAFMSFGMALGAATTGIVFYFLALRQMMVGNLPLSKLSLIAGVNIHIISAIGFYLYARTSHQFSAFHACLERSNRFLLANTMCDNLDAASKNNVRQEIIRIIAKAPLMSVDLVEHGERQGVIQTDVSNQEEVSTVRD